jgi:hypothetical protein
MSAVPLRTSRSNAFAGACSCIAIMTMLTACSGRHADVDVISCTLPSVVSVALENTLTGDVAISATGVVIYRELDDYLIVAEKTALKTSGLLDSRSATQASSPWQIVVSFRDGTVYAVRTVLVHPRLNCVLLSVSAEAQKGIAGYVPFTDTANSGTALRIQDGERFEYTEVKVRKSIATEGIIFTDAPLSFHITGGLLFDSKMKLVGFNVLDMTSTPVTISIDISTIVSDYLAGKFSASFFNSMRRS